MAGKTKEMSQIKQLLLLKKEAVSNRKAAALVGIDKETVNNYVKKARKPSVNPVLQGSFSNIGDIFKIFRVLQDS